MDRSAINRRRFLKGAGATGLIGLAPQWLRAAERSANRKPDDRILVVVELSGGNDGLNTVVPYADDAYYNHRPEIGIRPERLLKIDDHYGFNPGMLGFDRLWKTGDLAIIHGAGYDNPSYSHFTSMAYWHTASPNSGDAYGWVGRLADNADPSGTPNYLVNIDSRQSLAVQSRRHAAVVFDDPDRFQRKALIEAEKTLDALPGEVESANTTHDYLKGVARSAREGSALIRRAWQNYSSPVDYGIAPMDLQKVAACIDAGLDTRLYYVAFRNNSFDTHVQQPNLHERLLSYACDAIHGFVRDLERMGLADRVVVLAFSEFGRRVPENANLGTDHGAAGLMFLAGNPIQGGHYGPRSSLTDLLEGDNLKATVDFRQVYATVIDGWVAPGRSSEVLKGVFETLPVFG